MTVPITVMHHLFLAVIVSGLLLLVTAAGLLVVRDPTSRRSQSPAEPGRRLVWTPRAQQ
jgi:hypothetical protein